VSPIDFVANFLEQLFAANQLSQTISTGRLNRRTSRITSSAPIPDLVLTEV
jgi:hypothetical protein